MEKMGYGKSYYEDVEKAKKSQQQQQQEDNGNTTTAATKISDNADIDKSKLPSPNDNPLDECRLAIAYYKRCCDRELKKKKNWILTEPYRVQEEYRYKSKSG